MGGGHITLELLETEIGGVPWSTPRPGQPEPPKEGGFQAAMQYAEKQLLASALEACAGNKTAAANSLGMKPSTFRDKLTKHGLK
jgi:DNA-binding NtrC family response regulator